MAGQRRKTREDGATYETGIADYDPGVCGYCGMQLVARRKGRPPRFCGPTCRSGAYRHSTPTRKVKQGLSKGQTG